MDKKKTPIQHSSKWYLLSTNNFWTNYNKKRIHPSSANKSAK